jgi:hypothetical protein
LRSRSEQMLQTGQDAEHSIPTSQLQQQLVREQN